jgi:hypothetical protein
MLAPVVEHVDERIAYLARRAEQPGVEAIRPHSTAAPERAVDGLGDANGETLNATSETRGRVRFNEQMHVIALDAELENPEPVAARGGQRTADGREDATLSK